MRCVNMMLLTSLNFNMHLIISRAQKQIQYSSEYIKTVKCKTQNMTQTCNNEMLNNTNIIYVLKGIVHPEMKFL